MSQSLSNYVKQRVTGLEPIPQKQINDNFDYVWLKLFGDITGKDIVKGSIQGVNIAKAAIDNAHIKDAAIDNAKIAIAAIDSANIREAAIKTAHIANAAITSVKIGEAQIDTAHIADAAITSVKIEDASIKSVHIDEGQIKEAHIGIGQIKTAHIDDAQIVNAKIQDATITGAKISHATIESTNIAAAAIKAANIDYAAIDTAHIKDAAITSVKILDGAIGNAQVSSLDIAKLNAGDISTAKFTIIGSDGRLKIQDNLLQIFDGAATPFERVALGDINKDGSKYGLLVRGADGQTVLFDESGQTAEGFTDGYSKLANNSLDPEKINIERVVSRINSGVETIDASKILLDDKTLDVQFSTTILDLNGNIDAAKTYAEQKATEAQEAAENYAKLKAEAERVLAESYASGIVSTEQQARIDDVNAKLQTAKTHADTKAEEAETAAKNYADLKKQEAIDSANFYTNGQVGPIKTTIETHTGQITAMNSEISAKLNSQTFTEYKTLNDGEIQTIKSNLNVAETSITAIQGKITNKVWQTDITKAVEDIEIGGRNLLQDSEKEITKEEGSPQAEYVSVGVYDIFNPLVDKEITISFDLKSSIGGPISVYTLGRHAITKHVFETTTEYQRFSFTTTIIDKGTDHTWTNLSFYGTYGTGRIPAVHKIKIEKGNKATDWTPAPEDIDVALDSKTDYVTTKDAIETITEMGSTVQQLVDEITNTVTSKEFTDLEDIVKALESNVSQTAEDYSIEFNMLKTAVNENETILSEVTSYFDFTTDELDRPLLNIGKSDSPLNISISNEDMKFIDSGATVASISGQRLYITHAEVLEDLTVGVHAIEKYNDDITLIRWVGGDVA